MTKIVHPQRAAMSKLLIADMPAELPMSAMLLAMQLRLEQLPMLQVPPGAASSAEPCSSARLMWLPAQRRAGSRTTTAATTSTTRGRAHRCRSTRATTTMLRSTPCCSRALRGGSNGTTVSTAMPVCAYSCVSPASWPADHPLSTSSDCRCILTCR